MTKKKTKNKAIYLSVMLIMLVIGITYAYWVLTVSQTNTNTLASSCVKIELTNEANDIALQKAFPILDEEGMSLTPYEFTLTNTCDNALSYSVNLEALNTSTLDSKYIKVNVDNGSPILYKNQKEKTKIDSRATISRSIYEGRLFPGASKTHHVRIWMDENITLSDKEATMNKFFESKITVEALPTINYYYEEILNGAIPEVTGDLIPVTIASDGTVKKADETKKWYSYEEKEWANAVILNNNGISYNVDDVIPEGNIESYFVWVPRYRYQIFNDGNYPTRTAYEQKEQIVNIEFESKDTTLSNGKTVGSWLTHPAFTAFNTNGMWVGKFETGKKGGSDNVTAPNQVQIKPNVASWRNIQVANAFYTTYDYKRNLDSHMMKNTEWGAVAYLSMSNYGRGVEEIRMNNNSNYITGYASVNAPTCGYTGDNQDCNKYGTASTITKPYNTDIGGLASTTGNITGIYDMSGGTWEYAMGIMVDQNGTPASGRNNNNNSGFVGTLTYPNDESNPNKTTWTTADGGVSWPDGKYYDTYPYATTDARYDRRILGDATGEMGPFGTATYGSQTRNISSWHADNANFVNYTIPWFLRGGSHVYGTGAGVSAFYSASGLATAYGFRIVLMP